MKTSDIGGSRSSFRSNVYRRVFTKDKQSLDPPPFPTLLYEARDSDPEPLAAIAAEAEWLADGDDPRFMSEVALGLQSE